MDLCILLVTFSKNYYCWKKGISAIDKYTILIMSIPKRKKFDLFVFFFVKDSSSFANSLQFRMEILKIR